MKVHYEFRELRPMPPAPRGKYWCFTVNNFTDTEFERLSTAQERAEDILYICFGKEVGESGTPHLQGYVEFAQKIRLGGVKRIDGFARAHLELRAGSQAQAIEYCKKDGDFYEFGERFQSKSGQRTDLVTIKERIDAGASTSEIAEEHFGSWCRYRKSFDAYRMVKRVRTVRDLRVVCFWGRPGTGKTRAIFEREPSLFIAPTDNLQWFDGYEGEEALLIDDYRGGGDPSFLLRLLDIYPLQLPVKGGFVPLLATRIYITSNLEPPFGVQCTVDALLRRIHKTVRMDNLVDFNDEALISSLFE